MSDGLSEYGTKKGFSGHEERLRQLAKTPRDVRRELMICLHNLVTEASSASPTPGQVRTQSRVYAPPPSPNNAYLFVVCSSEGLPDEPTYREGRRNWLIGYAILTLKRNPHFDDVVGIAVGPNGDKWGASEDILYVNRSMLIDEDFKSADEFEARISHSQLHSTVRRIIMPTKRPGRNDPCPCGSGLKFKRCHGGRD